MNYFGYACDLAYALDNLCRYEIEHRTKTGSVCRICLLNPVEDKTDACNSCLDKEKNKNESK